MPDEMSQAEADQVDKIVRRVRELLDHSRAEAAAGGDFTEAVRLADCTARMENQMAARGVDVRPAILSQPGALGFVLKL